jgi:phosphate/sulfate permease
MQERAFQLADKGIGTYQPYLDAASQFTLQATQAYDPSEAYKPYMNPYQNEVIGAIEQQFDKAQNLQNQQATQAGAFGGARQGIQSAELAAQQAQTVGTAQAQNYGQAQQQAQAQFASQMGRYGEAAKMAAGLGGQAQQQQLGDIASLMSAGSVQQQNQQQQLDAQYQQQLQQLYEPYQRLGFTSDIYQGMPSSAMAISMGTSPGSNPLAQTVGAGITGLAGYQAIKGN